jgi:hypothetical protein
MIDIEQEPDEIPARRLGRVGLWTVVAVVGCAFVTWLLSGWAGVPQDPTIPSVGPVELELFTRKPTILETEREADRARLRRWGWVDKSGQRVHVPLSIAIDLYLRRTR